MFCPKCGKEIPDGAKFCKFCGNEIKKNRGPIKGRIVKKGNVKKDEKASPVLIGAVVVAAIVLVVLVVLAMGVLNNDSSSDGSSNGNVLGISQSSQSSNGQVAEDTVQSVSLSAFPVSEAPNLAQALAEQGYPSSINFKSVTLDSLLKMLTPLVGMLVLSALGIIILCVIAGKFFHYSPAISAAVGLTALFGYPCTQIITDEVVSSLPVSDAEKEAIHNQLLPKMLIAGFTTVTIASVIFAGIIIPMIF